MFAAASALAWVLGVPMDSGEDHSTPVSASTSRQLINTPSTVVDDALEGICRMYSGTLCLMPKHRVVVRSDIEEHKKNHVTILSGGGSGHEPAHAGYVGKGMLSACVCGDVFASPPTSAVLAAIEAIAGPRGVLMIVKNYTGDRLHFGLALEQARARGHNVRMIIVDDDVAIESPGRAGARGLAGTVFVHKLLGAAAEQGRTLEELYEGGEMIVKQLATVGVACSPCVVPGAGPSFSLPPGIVELGLGIHGEQGAQQRPLLSASSVCREMVDMLMQHDATFMRGSHRHVALMINNLGATSNLEMGVVSKHIVDVLSNVYNTKVSRAFLGSFMTSLNMSGISISILKMDHEHQRYFNMSVADLLDFPTTAFAWTHSSLSGDEGELKTSDKAVEDWKSLTFARLEVPLEQQPLLGSPSDSSKNNDILGSAIRRACMALIEKEEELNRFDTQIGDGDCGSTMARAAKSILAAMDRGEINLSSSVATLAGLEHAIESMGGTSGAIYSILLAAAQAAYRESDQMDIVTALLQGLESIEHYGGATEGDRTMLDIWYPTLRALQFQQSQSLSSIATNAVELAYQKSIDMRPNAGRASYVRARAETQLIPDPGAYAAAQMITAFFSASRII